MWLSMNLRPSESIIVSDVGPFKYIVRDLYLSNKEKSVTSVFVIPTSVLVITTL